MFSATSDHPTQAFNGHRFDTLAPPTWRASTVRFDSLDAFLQRSERLPDGYSYGTTGTPTHRHLEARIAALDGARHALVLPSGQAAVALAMLHGVGQGDHLLISASAYGPAITFARRHLARLGVDVELYDPRVGAAIAQQLKPTTRLIWLESPGSLTLEVQDVAAIADVARKAGVRTAIDNTWASPLYSRPLDFGVDLCLHACTKYMGGHSDLLMGSLSTNDASLYGGLRELQAYMGQVAGADDCILVERGLDTLALRMQVQSAQALALAASLRRHPMVAQVLHPGLPDSTDHALWARQATGHGAVFAFEPRAHDEAGARAFFAGLERFAIGASWGSVHSLAAYYPAALQRGRPFCGVTGALVRLSVGVEPLDALQADLELALDRMRRCS